MQETALMVIAFCTVLWNYSVPQRYMRYEEGQVYSGRRGTRMFFLKLANYIGLQESRKAALSLMFICWVILDWYFLSIGWNFNAGGLKVVATVTAVFTTIGLFYEMNLAYHNFVQWCYYQEENLLLLTKGCWELILAGLVVINIMYI